MDLLSAMGKVKTVDLKSKEFRLLNEKTAIERRCNKISEHYYEIRRLRKELEDTNDYYDATATVLALGRMIRWHKDAIKRLDKEVARCQRIYNEIKNESPVSEIDARIAKLEKDLKVLKEERAKYE